MPDIIELTAETVCAYVSKNPLPAAELPALMKSVYESIAHIGNVMSTAEPAPHKPTPPVSIKKSLTDDYLVCLEDGLKFKSLKRHLSTKYAMTPDAYRTKWGLPPDYPMVAPSYAKTRSALALSLGLGRKPAAPPPAPVKVEPAAPPTKAAARKIQPEPAIAAVPAPIAAKPARRGRKAKVA